MRPPCDHILRTLATVLATKYLPTFESDHARAEISLTALTMGVVSEEIERGTHRRIEENNELRRIFKQAMPVVQDENLKKRLMDASEKKEVDFHTSALDQLNCELLAVLIDLHAHVEDLDSEDGRNLNKLIWEEVEKQVKRREFMTWEVAEMMLASAMEAPGE